MRWKLFLGSILVVALIVCGTIGWYRLQNVRRQSKIAETLELAKNQIAMGNHPRAQANLEALLAENAQFQRADAVWALLARSYETTGNADKALACWKKIQEGFLDSDSVDNALSALAEKAYTDGKYAEAEQLWKQILDRYKGSDAVADAELGMARMKAQSESPQAARDALWVWLDKNPESPRRSIAEEMLGRVNLEVLYSSELGEGDQIYAIKKGDKLETIGKQFHISPDLILRINHIRDVRALRVGRRLKIAKTEFSIIVDKTDNTLTLFNGGKFFKRYRVRTGKDDWRTPPGEYRVLTRVKNPSWNNPEDGVTYPPGDPKNALGTRWMAFEGSLGIHGTLDPSTIGTYASNGCVGMLKEDVEELFDLAPVGTTVKITGKMVNRGNQEKPSQQR